MRDGTDATADGLNHPDILLWRCMSFCAAIRLEKKSRHSISYAIPLRRQAPLRVRDHAAMDPCRHTIGIAQNISVCYTLFASSLPIQEVLEGLTRLCWHSWIWFWFVHEKFLCALSWQAGCYRGNHTKGQKSGAGPNMALSYSALSFGLSLCLLILVRSFVRRARVHSISHLPGPPPGPWSVGR